MCRIIITIVKIPDTIARLELLKNNAVSGVKIAAIIAEREDILDIKATINQTNAINIPIIQHDARRKPKKVATPFPPLNFSHTG